MIERRTIAGLEYEKAETEADFELWCEQNGFSSAHDFELRTFILPEQLIGRWFFVNKAGDDIAVYARSMKGGVQLLCGERQRHR